MFLLPLSPTAFGQRAGRAAPNPRGGTRPLPCRWPEGERRGSPHHLPPCPHLPPAARPRHGGNRGRAEPCRSLSLPFLLFPSLPSPLPGTKEAGAGRPPGSAALSPRSLSPAQVPVPVPVPPPGSHLGPSRRGGALRAAAWRSPPRTRRASGRTAARHPPRLPAPAAALTQLAAAADGATPPGETLPGPERRRLRPSAASSSSSSVPSRPAPVPPHRPGTGRSGAEPPAPRPARRRGGALGLGGSAPRPPDRQRGRGEGVGGERGAAGCPSPQNAVQRRRCCVCVGGGVVVVVGVSAGCEQRQRGEAQTRSKGGRREAGGYRLVIVPFRLREDRE